jgi:hypothetical protein
MDGEVVRNSGNEFRRNPSDNVVKVRLVDESVPVVRKKAALPYEPTFRSTPCELVKLRTSIRGVCKL